MKILTSAQGRPVPATPEAIGKIISEARAKEGFAILVCDDREAFLWTGWGPTGFVIQYRPVNDPKVYRCARRDFSEREVCDACRQFLSSAGKWRSAWPHAAVPDSGIAVYIEGQLESAPTRIFGDSLWWRALLVLLVLGALAAYTKPWYWFHPKVLGESEQARVDAAPLGSVDNPVRCDGGDGERAYLARLLCPSGKRARYRYWKSARPGPYGSILDRYDLQCAEWREPRTVWMDLEHRGYVEQRPVAGLTIVPVR